MLAGVVVDVFRPDPAHTMRNPMIAVVAQIIEDEGDHKYPPVQAEIKKAELPNPKQSCHGNETEQQTRRNIARPHQQACKSVSCLKFALALPIADCHELNQNSQHIKRDRNTRHIEKYRIAIHAGSPPQTDLKARLSLFPDPQHY